MCQWIYVNSMIPCTQGKPKVEADAYANWALAGCFCLLRAQACLQPIIPVKDPLVLSRTFILRHIKHAIYVAQPIKIAICHLRRERPVK